MSDKPLVSIVTVVLNAKGHIEETILSVLNQTYDNIEYIVVDGGSTDGTLHVCEAYRDHIDVLLSEPDRGISDAFNKGVKLASGDLIGIINAGDRYAPDTVDRVVEWAEARPDAALFYSDIDMISADGSVLYRRKAARELTAESFRYRMPAIPHPTVFARRAAYTHAAYDEALHMVMDYKWLRTAVERGCKTVYVEEFPLASMRVEGASNSRYDKTLKEMYAVSTAYGDSRIISYAYNLIFRRFRFECRRLLSRSSAGLLIVKGYRRILAASGVRKWTYDPE